MAGRKFRQVALVANTTSLRAIEQSVNLKLGALQLKDPTCEIKDVSCGAFIAPVPGLEQKTDSKGNPLVNLLWLATISYETEFPANISRDLKRSDHRETRGSVQDSETVFVVDKKQD